MSFHPINFREELNDEQFAAVTAPDGPALVLAGAGSGKTRTLTYRVAYLILERKVDPRDLLLLTFTNKAAREMVERVMEITASRYPPTWGGTFHSVGGRILRVHGEKIGLAPNYTILDSSDADSLLTNVIKEEDKSFLRQKENPKAKVIFEVISYARNTCRPIIEVADERFHWLKGLPQRIVTFAKLYEAKKLELQVADYDDLLVYWLKLLQENEDVLHYYRSKFSHVLVDEYQDTNALQSRIVDLIAAHRNIMAVGDDAQCIYTWRGAEFENIRSFPERYEGTTIYKILRNYRSTPEILSLANAVLRAQPPSSGYEKELHAARHSGQIPYLVPVMDTRQQADFIISRIEGLYEQGYALGDIAILYRAHFQALDLQLEFTRRSIPFVITSGVKFFEQAHIRDFVAQLRFVSNPQDLQALERLMCLLPKVGPATVKKVLKEAGKWVREAREENRKEVDSLFAREGGRRDERLVVALGREDVVAKIPEDAREDYRQMVATLRQLDELMRDAEHKVSPAYVVECGIEGWYGDFIQVAYTDADRRREDLESLIGFAQRFATMPELLAQLVLLNSETSDKSVELNEDCVRMTTVHQAKGLEYPVVFVISCAEDLFPLKRAVENGDMEEERRLFYVAVTRAMNELYLCYPMLNSGRGGPMRLEPSTFLREIPPSQYEKLGYRVRRW